MAVKLIDEKMRSKLGVSVPMHRVVCPLCHVAPARAGVKDGRCLPCRRSADLYPVNYRGRRTKKVAATTEENYSKV